MRMRYRRRRDTLVDALSGFDVGISGLAAGVNLVLTLPGDTEHEVPEVPDPDGIIVDFAAPAEHAFAPAVDAHWRY